MRPIYTILDIRKPDDEHEPEVLVRWVDSDAHTHLYGIGYKSWTDDPAEDWCSRWYGTRKEIIKRLKKEIEECEPGHYRWASTKQFLDVMEAEVRAWQRIDGQRYARRRKKKAGAFN